MWLFSVFNNVEYAGLAFFRQVQVSISYFYICSERVARDQLTQQFSRHYFCGQPAKLIACIVAYNFGILSACLVSNRSPMSIISLLCCQYMISVCLI